jgi:sphinganine-1-phosphate aldolase
MKAKSISFPDKGIDSSSLIEEMKAVKSADAEWRNGRVFGYIYHPGDDDARLAEEAYQMFFYENALNPSLFNSLKKFENETVAMVASLLNGTADTVGNLTSGGTESILLAVKTARDKARADRPAIRGPEILVPESIHPAFEKAAHYVNVKVVHIPVTDDKRVDIRAMEDSISGNTILLVGSAPCFPHGVIDPIREIGGLGLKYGIPVHVDACLGGLMLPFVEKLGYSVGPFDFRVPGVTSISADLHKYGYSSKGASVILYINSEFRKHQYFVYTDWSGGLYGSPTMMGTKCGGPIASSWAMIKHLGYKGYLEKASKVMLATRQIQEGIGAIEGLEVISNPEMSVFAFTSDKYDIFNIGDALTARGWHLDRLQYPNSLHMTVSYGNYEQASEFLRALEDSINEVAGDKVQQIQSQLTVSMIKGFSRILPERWFRAMSKALSGLFSSEDRNKPSKSAAMYGASSAIDNRKNVHDMVLDVMDKMYRIWYGKKKE